MTADLLKGFRALHVTGDPIVLYNIWDAGSARAVADAGAKAIATGSWSVAGAQGYPDGEKLPLGSLILMAERIVASVDLPVSIDFEGGYAVAPEKVARNVARIAATGAAGINFEDQVVGGAGLHAVELQAERLAAIRAAVGADLFINARTDLFLKNDPSDHARHLDQALSRAAAYATAGADGFFAPGLSDVGLIRALCEGTDLPVNILRRADGPEIGVLAGAGVARVSHGPLPWRAAMAALTEATVT